METGKCVNCGGNVVGKTRQGTFYKFCLGCAKRVHPEWFKNTGNKSKRKKFRLNHDVTTRKITSEDLLRLEEAKKKRRFSPEPMDLARHHGTNTQNWEGGYGATGQRSSYPIKKKGNNKKKKKGR